jgi:hypothetical protein
VREALTGQLPAGWSIGEIQDVWLAGPALAGRVVAADYRIALSSEGGELDPGALAGAADRLLAARSLPRQRARGGGSVPYDLRPLVLDVALAEPGPPPTIRARTRFHAELGTGRPEEVVGALGELCGRPLVAASIVRERLILAEDLDGPSDRGGGGLSRS